jgi:hypothetical protein
MLGVRYAAVVPVEGTANTRSHDIGFRLLDIGDADNFILTLTPQLRLTPHFNSSDQVTSKSLV